MRCWDLNAISLSPQAPEILESSDEGRAIILEIPAGGSLREHQVHERAWLVVVSGEVTISDGAQSVSGGAGLMLEFDPSERHSVEATSTARLLLLLTPWPGEGHPGAIDLEEKRTVRQRAAERR